jgi:Ser/Thr protein kinase RdoA (MazF antagonist)
MKLPDLKTHFQMEGASISPFDASGASVNHHFLVVHGAKKYVLRNIRTSTAIHRLDEIHGIISQWENGEIPLPMPILTVDGIHTIYLEEGTWQLTSYLSGSPYSFTMNEMKKSAKLLRKLHVASPTGFTSDNWLSNELAKIEKELPELEKWSPPLATLLKKQLSWLNQFKNSPLPSLIATHGDFHGLNILFEQDEVKALLDFDNVDFRPRLYDIAHAILMLCRLERGSYQIRPLWAQKFLEAYEDSLTQDEFKMLPAMIFLSKIPSVKLFEELSSSGFNAIERAEYYHRVLTAIMEQAHAIL